MAVNSYTLENTNPERAAPAGASQTTTPSSNAASDPAFALTSPKRFRKPNSTPPTSPACPVYASRAELARALRELNPGTFVFDRQTDGTYVVRDHTGTYTGEIAKTFYGEDGECHTMAAVVDWRIFLDRLIPALHTIMRAPRVDDRGQTAFVSHTSQGTFVVNPPSLPIAHFTSAGTFHLLSHSLRSRCRQLFELYRHAPDDLTAHGAHAELAGYARLLKDCAMAAAGVEHCTPYSRALVSGSLPRSCAHPPFLVCACDQGAARVECAEDLSDAYVPQSGDRSNKQPHHPPASWKKIQELQRTIEALERRIKQLEAKRDAERSTRAIRPQSGLRAVADYFSEKASDCCEALRDPGVFNAAILAIVASGMAVVGGSAIIAARAASRAATDTGEATRAAANSLSLAGNGIADAVAQVRSTLAAAVRQAGLVANVAKHALVLATACVALVASVKYGRMAYSFALTLLEAEGVEDVVPCASVPIAGIASLYVMAGGYMPAPLRKALAMSTVLRGIDFTARSAGDAVDWALEQIIKCAMWLCKKTACGVPMWLARLHADRFESFARLEALRLATDHFQSEYATGKRTDVITNACYLRDLMAECDDIGLLRISGEGEGARKYRQVRDTLVAMCRAVQVQTAACGDIPEPVAVALIGSAGAGKSLVSKTFLTEVVARCMPPATTAVERLDPTVHIWSRPTGAKFADGYTGQFAVLLDDYNISRGTENDPESSDPAWVVRYVNTSPTQMNMAELSKKGATPFTSRLVLITSNAPNIASDVVSQHLHDTGAFKRRLTVCVDFKPTEAFTRNGKLDYSKYQSHVSGGGSQDAVWDMAEYDWPDPGTRRSITYTQLRERVCAELTERLATYRSLVDARLRLFSEVRKAVLEPVEDDAEPQSGWHWLAYARRWFSGEERSHSDLPTPPPPVKRESPYQRGFFKPPPGTLRVRCKHDDPAGYPMSATHEAYVSYWTGRVVTPKQRLLLDYPDLWLLYAIHHDPANFPWCEAPEYAREDYVGACVKTFVDACRTSAEWVGRALGRFFDEETRSVMKFTAINMCVMVATIPIVATIVTFVVQGLTALLRWATGLPVGGKKKKKKAALAQSGARRATAVPPEVETVIDNQYSLICYRDGTATPVGHLLALGGRDFLSNKHFVDEQADCYELRSKHNHFKVTPEAYKKLFSAAQDVGDDMCVVRFEGPGVTGYPMERNIRHLLIKTAASVHASELNDCLIHSHSGIDPIQDLFMHKPAVPQDAISVSKDGGQVPWHNLLHVKGSLGAGFCGSLIFARTAEGWRVVGSYVAGSPVRGIGSGFFMRVTQQDLEVAPHSGPRDEWVPAIPPVHINRVSRLRKDHAVVQALGELAPTKIPAQLRPVDGVDPLYKALDKYLIEPPILSEAECNVVRDAGTAVLSFAAQQEPIPPNRPLLSYDEAINGVPGWIDALPKDTSAGYPYCATKVPGVDVLCSNVPISQRKTILLDPATEQGQVFRTRLELLDAMLRAGHAPCLPYVAFLKDETRKPEKVASADTRLICGAPLELCILWRRYYGAFEAWIKQGHTRNGICVGINPLGADWSILVHRQGGLDQPSFAGDYSGFDTCQHGVFFENIALLANKWYSALDNQDAAARVTLASMLKRPLVVVGDRMCELARGLPSGHPGTAIINSITNLTLLKLAYDSLARGRDSHPPPFFEAVRPLVWGDDNVLSASPAILSWFNQNTVGSPLAAYGFTYTAENKANDAPDWRPLREVSFLKRGFRTGPDGSVASPLEVPSILNALVWSRRRLPPAEALLKFRAAMVELSQHPQDTWCLLAPLVHHASVQSTGLLLEHGSSVSDQLRWYALKSTYPDPTALWHR